MRLCNPSRVMGCSLNSLFSQTQYFAASFHKTIIAENPRRGRGRQWTIFFRSGTLFALRVYNVGVCIRINGDIDFWPNPIFQGKRLHSISSAGDAAGRQQSMDIAWYFVSRHLRRYSIAEISGLYCHWIHPRALLISNNTFSTHSYKDHCDLLWNYRINKFQLVRFEDSTTSNLWRDAFHQIIILK